MVVNHALNGSPLLEVRDLQVQFRTDDGLVKAVDGVSFSIARGETLGLVGESGCGKTVTAFSLLRLLPSPPAEVAGGSVTFAGENLLSFTERRMQEVRGRSISMIFQEPMSSLNPVMTVGRQISEVILRHQGRSRSEARTIAIETLRRVGIPAPETRVDEYPHQMSGGMKQRVMIAMALVCQPQLLIADEPTTALDVTVQAQILRLLRAVQRESGTSVLLITHDLGVVAETCDRVAVMYAGKIVEQAAVATLFDRPRHPYTRGLFKSLPDVGARRDRLAVIPGSVPSPLDFPSGCRFRTRCSMAESVCEAEPPLREISAGHFAACHFAEQLEREASP